MTIIDNNNLVYGIGTETKMRFNRVTLNEATDAELYWSRVIVDNATTCAQLVFMDEIKKAGNSEHVLQEKNNSCVFATTLERDRKLRKNEEMLNSGKVSLVSYRPVSDVKKDDSEWNSAVLPPQLSTALKIERYTGLDLLKKSIETAEELLVHCPSSCKLEQDEGMSHERHVIKKENHPFTSLQPYSQNAKMKMTREEALVSLNIVTLSTSRAKQQYAKEEARKDTLNCEDGMAEYVHNYVQEITSGAMLQYYSKKDESIAEKATDNNVTTFEEDIVSRDVIKTTRVSDSLDNGNVRHHTSVLFELPEVPIDAEKYGDISSENTSKVSTKHNKYVFDCLKKLSFSAIQQTCHSIAADELHPHSTGHDKYMCQHKHVLTRDVAVQTSRRRNKKTSTKINSSKDTNESPLKSEHAIRGRADTKLKHDEAHLEIRKTCKEDKVQITPAPSETSQQGVIRKTGKLRERELKKEPKTRDKPNNNPTKRNVSILPLLKRRRKNEASRLETVKQKNEEGDVGGSKKQKNDKEDKVQITPAPSETSQQGVIKKTGKLRERELKKEPKTRDKPNNNPTKRNVSILSLLKRRRKNEASRLETVKQKNEEGDVGGSKKQKNDIMVDKFEALILAERQSNKPTKQRQLGATKKNTEPPKQRQGGAAKQTNEQPVKQRQGETVKQKNEPPKQRQGEAAKQTNEPSKQRQGGAAKQTNEPSKQRQGGAAKQTNESPVKQRQGGTAKQKNEPPKQRQSGAAKQTNEPPKDKATPTKKRSWVKTLKKKMSRTKSKSSEENSKTSSTSKKHSKPDDAESEL
uniref:Axoneme-associated protein mst101(2)-like n=1 Tax=Saccoglossus kowalevskii TaxID=10224 RepID=A0ABM0MD81_SACKO|nr:PREDICTED: axoneme-associated protein mst101(2)-like [Saccoglossus kowalevskii]